MTGPPVLGLLVLVSGALMLAPLGGLATARIVVHDRTVALAQLNSFTFWIYLPAYAVAAAAVLYRRWALAASALVVVYLHLWWVLPDYVPAESIPAEARAAPTLRVFSVNLFINNPGLSSIIGEIVGTDPDLLLVQEFTPRAARALEQAGIARRLPYQLLDTDSGVFGTGIYSRYPLANGERWTAAGTPMTRATVEVEGRTLRVYNVHTTSPSSPDSFTRWNANFAALIEAARAEGGLLMLAGDFNANQHHQWYTGLERVPLHSCHGDRGRGNATTWPNGMNRLPPIRIDHVFLSPGVTCLSIREGDGVGSDHKPLVAEIALPE